MSGTEGPLPLRANRVKRPRSTDKTDERMRGLNRQDSSCHFLRLAPVVSGVAASRTLVGPDRDVPCSAFALSFPQISQFDSLS